MIAAVCLTLFASAFAAAPGVSRVAARAVRDLLRAEQAAAEGVAACCCAVPDPAAAPPCGCCGDDLGAGDPAAPAAPCECDGGDGGMPPLAPAPVVEGPIGPGPSAPAVRWIPFVAAARSPWRGQTATGAATGPPIHVRFCVWLI